VSLAPARRQSGSSVSFRPNKLSPLSVSQKKSKSNKKRDVSAHAAPIKKRDKLLCPFHVAVALPCVSGVVHLCRDIFFVVFSAVTACYHCVHIASFLNDFDHFSYSLSTASC
jgi:hypothetical protein